MNKLFLLPVLGAALTFGACNNAAKNNSDSTEMAMDSNRTDKGLDKMDAKFVSMAASGGMLEVEASKLALTKTSNDSIKMFANMMIMDHTKANDKLKAIAMEQNLVVPPTMSEDHMKKLTNLQGKSGKEFEKAYADLMDDDHKDDVDLFQDEANKGEDPKMKAFAAETLPTLQMHAAMAKRMDAMMEKM